MPQARNGQRIPEGEVVLKNTNPTNKQYWLIVKCWNGYFCPPTPAHLEGEQIGEAFQTLHAPVHVVSQEQKLPRCDIHPQLPYVVGEEVEVLAVRSKGSSEGGQSHAGSAPRETCVEKLILYYYRRGNTATATEPYLILSPT